MCRAAIERVLLLRCLCRLFWLRRADRLTHRAQAGGLRQTRRPGHFAFQTTQLVDVIVDQRGIQLALAQLMAMPSIEGILKLLLQALLTFEQFGRGRELVGQLAPAFSLQTALGLQAGEVVVIDAVAAVEVFPRLIHGAENLFQVRVEVGAQALMGANGFLAGLMVADDLVRLLARLFEALLNLVVRGRQTLPLAQQRAVTRGHAVFPRLTRQLLHLAQQVVAAGGQCVGLLGIGAALGEGVARLTLHVTVSLGIAHQTLEAGLAGDAGGSGMAHGGDGVVAGLMDQRLFIFQTAQCRQTQLLVVAAGRHGGQQFAIVQALDQLFTAQQ